MHTQQVKGDTRSPPTSALRRCASPWQQLRGSQPADGSSSSAPYDDGPLPLVSACAADHGGEEEAAARESTDEDGVYGYGYNESVLRQRRAARARDMEAAYDALGGLFAGLGDEEEDAAAGGKAGPEGEEGIVVVARDEARGLARLRWRGERLWVAAQEAAGLPEAVDGEEGSTTEDDDDNDKEGSTSNSMPEPIVGLLGPGLSRRLLRRRGHGGVLQRWREEQRQQQAGQRRRRRQQQSPQDEAGAEGVGAESSPPWEETVGDLVLLRQLLPFVSMAGAGLGEEDDDEEEDEKEEEREGPPPLEAGLARLLAAFRALEEEEKEDHAQNGNVTDADADARLEARRLRLLDAFTRAAAARAPRAKAVGLVEQVERETVAVPDKHGAAVPGVGYVAASGRGVANLGVDDPEQVWESHGARRVTVKVPYDQVWSELRLKAEEYGNYSPEVMSVAVYVPRGPAGSGGRKKVYERTQIPVSRSGWVTLLEIRQVLAAIPSPSASASASASSKQARCITAEELMTPPLGLGRVGGYALEIEVTVVRNHDHGINSKMNCLRVVQGKVVMRPGQRDRRSFGYKGVRESFVVPESGQYRIEAKGASAPHARHKRGGRAAVAEGVFFLSKGDQVAMVVGGSGKRRESDTGGGGGSFAWLRAAAAPRVIVPLVVAGGGGGSRGLRDDFDGQDASLTPAGGAGRGLRESGAAGGRFGADGKRAGTYGSGGLGVWTVARFCTAEAAAGRGGFGGGGTTGTPGGGGGGGYSGGGGGRGGGGGGSYVAPGARGKALRVGHVGNGEIIITYLRPRLDVAALAPVDRLRLAVLRRALRAGVETVALLRARLQRREEGAGVAKEEWESVAGFFNLVRELFPSTVFPRALRPLHEWLLELTLRLDRQRWLLPAPSPSTSSSASSSEVGADDGVVKAARALLGQWRVQRALAKNVGLGGTGKGTFGIGVCLGHTSIIHPTTAHRHRPTQPNTYTPNRRRPPGLRADGRARRHHLHHRALAGALPGRRRYRLSPRGQPLRAGPAGAPQGAGPPAGRARQWRRRRRRHRHRGRG